MSTSQEESLPKTIDASFKQDTNGLNDDISSLSNNHNQILSWLKPNSEIESLFCLSRANSRKVSKVWKFFHMVIGVREGIADSNLPAKWCANPIPIHWACCNMCGELVRAGSLRKNGKFVYANGSMLCHLQTKVHQSKGLAVLLQEVETATPVDIGE